ncbi:MAG: acyltransferase [Bacteroidetes bacterium]|nr:acyltransferase [Bacteroidota bacterium]
MQVLTIGLLPSFLKKIIYRMKGYTIGRGVKLGLGSVIIGKDVEIGKGTSVGFLTVIRGKKIVIGKFVTIGSLTFMDTERIELGDDCRIREQVHVGGLSEPGSMLKLGKRCCIMQMSNLNPARPIIVGDDSGIGGDCLLFTHASWLSQLEGFPVKFAPITIGKNVWIPWRVFITAGVTIGDNVLVGPNTVISKDIPSNSVAAGTPLKISSNVFKPVNENSRKKILNEIFGNFVKHLEYGSFACEFKTLDHGREWIFSDHEKHQVVYLAGKQDVMASSKDNILVLDYDHDDMKKFLDKKFCMIISLVKKERVGMSDVGEEFVRYLSRHGIRFDRVDD